MSLQSSRRIVWTLFAAAALSSAAAHAQSPADFVIQNRVVKFADLDLSRPADAAVLYSRLQSASRSVCFMNVSPQNLKLRRLQQECTDAALADAVAKVNSPSLAVVHDSSMRARIAQSTAVGQPQT